MNTHYYLSVYPLEALIASQLEPDAFGRYMALGRIRGSNERIMFIEIDGEFGASLPWDVAHSQCVPHEDGTPKHSVWMSVYRTLEQIPIDRLRTLHMTTRDGRTLTIDPTPSPVEDNGSEYFIYQELCPLHPLVVSRLAPDAFARFMTDPGNNVAVPKVIYADLKHVDPEGYVDSGNIGAAYDKNLEHLKACIAAVTSSPDKPNKNVERSVDSFTYQIIDRGVYAGDGSTLVHYRMPSREELKQNHYDWARSAMIL